MIAPLLPDYWYLLEGADSDGEYSNPDDTIGKISMLCVTGGAVTKANFPCSCKACTAYEGIEVCGASNTLLTVVLNAGRSDNPGAVRVEVYRWARPNDWRGETVAETFTLAEIFGSAEAARTFCLEAFRRIHLEAAEAVLTLPLPEPDAGPGQIREELKEPWVVAAAALPGTVGLTHFPIAVFLQCLVIAALGAALVGYVHVDLAARPWSVRVERPRTALAAFLFLALASGIISLIVWQITPA